MVRRVRLDTELVRRGLARSREQAADLIAAGRVAVGGQTAAKVATQVGQDAEITIAQASAEPDYASRGGRKLEGALAAFAGLSVAGRRCLDAAHRPAGDRAGPGERPPAHRGAGGPGTQPGHGGPFVHLAVAGASRAG